MLSCTHLYDLLSSRTTSFTRSKYTNQPKGEESSDKVKGYQWNVNRFGQLSYIYIYIPRSTVTDAYFKPRARNRYRNLDRRLVTKEMQLSLKRLEFLSVLSFLSIRSFIFALSMNLLMCFSCFISNNVFFLRFLFSIFEIPIHVQC